MEMGPNTLFFIENNEQDLTKTRGQQKVRKQLNNHVNKHQKGDPAKTREKTSFLNRTLSLSLYGLNKSLNLMYVPLFIYRTFEKPQRCPPITEPILKIPAFQLTEKIRNKEVSCEEVITKYIERINEVNPVLNAVIQNRFEDALEDARKIDRWIASDDFPKDLNKVAEEYPLLGLPITVKGSINVKGLKNTSGMVVRNHCIAEEDAVVVKQAREAGAIPLLVSNVPELCLNWETTNKLVGSTKNPYDTTRSCGGSSGGEASLLSSGASLLGIGSDIAGSLRLPAHFCGVWSHKPTPATVSDTGHYPNSGQRDAWEDCFTLGGMCRFSNDLKLLLKVLCKPDKRNDLRLSEEVDVKRIKIYYIDNLESTLCDKTNRHCSEAVSTVVEHFTNISNTAPKKAHIHMLRYATELAIIHLISIDDVDHIFDNKGNGTLAESARYVTGKSNYTFTTIAYGMLKKFYHSLPDKYTSNIVRDIQVLRDSFRQLLGDDGVFLMPTYHQQAFKHGDSLRNGLNSGYMSVFNALGFPVTNCPVGMGGNGLPVGVQVVGTPYSDRLTLAVAEEIERAFGGWVEP